MPYIGKNLSSSRPTVPSASTSRARASRNSYLGLSNSFKRSGTDSSSLTGCLFPNLQNYTSQYCLFWFHNFILENESVELDPRERRGVLAGRVTVAELKGGERVHVLAVVPVREAVDAGHGAHGQRLQFRLQTVQQTQHRLRCFVPFCKK
jgi:hypothetical protein